ncbi:MAG TPA: hypothetical protein VNO55_00765 [Polyangia bacterium]|nr:hypothetical protein [Polyangia bacterium]
MRAWRAPIFLVWLPLACGGSALDVRGHDAAVPTHCQDDSLGNATQMQSYPLTGATELPGLKLCPGTEDWFRLDARNAASFSVAACSAGTATVDFASFREEINRLYQHENCSTTGDKETCLGSCEIEAPGIYFYRLSAAQDVGYRLTVAFKPQVGMVSQTPPSIDMAPALVPGMPRDLTVCVPFAQWYRIEIGASSMATVESTLPYAGYYLDFTITDEAQRTVDYWPQGAGKTSHAMALGPGRYLLQIRSAFSGCRTFSLALSLAPG